MDIMIWLIAGAAVGWAGLHFFDMNHSRGMAISATICAVAGFLGGNSVAPMLTASTTAPVVGFSPFALVVAIAVAVLTLFISSELSRRFDI